MEPDQNSVEYFGEANGEISGEAISEISGETSAAAPAEMTETRYITQSKFFSSVFNAAIFDGPIRIYFAQYQEAQALKLYHNLQERFGDVRKQARGIFKERGCNIFVMLYPTEEIFADAFDSSFSSPESADDSSLGRGLGAEAGPHVQRRLMAQPVTHPQILQDRLGDDFVLGVCGQLEDESLDVICERMDSIVHSA